MTNKEWSARPDLIENFSLLLRDEVMQLALRVLEDAGAPRSKLRPDSPNLMENHALLNSKREGYFEALHNLRSLAVHRTPGPEVDSSPWRYAAEKE